MASSAANKLTTLQGWKDFFEGAEIPEEEAENYARVMLANRMSRASDLTKKVLQDLEITTMGDVLNILRATKATKKEKVQIRPNIQPPQVKSDLTPNEFRKFRIDWDVYKN